MNGSLLDQLIKQKYLKSPNIISAFKKIRRADFVPKCLEMTAEQIANYNAPLPIGYEQTISQPLTVAFLLELLQPQAKDKVLDIGSGSGWQSALLAEIVGPQGHIWSIEIIEKLKKFGEKNAAKYNFRNLDFICGDASRGFADQAPFNKIIAAAAAPKLPKIWLEQLDNLGRLVCPIKNSIWLYYKSKNGSINKKEYKGFVFVPLVTK